MMCTAQKVFIYIFMFFHFVIGTDIYAQQSEFSYTSHEPFYFESFLITDSSLVTIEITAAQQVNTLDGYIVYKNNKTSIPLSEVTNPSTRIFSFIPLFIDDEMTIQLTNPQKIHYSLSINGVSKRGDQYFTIEHALNHNHQGKILSSGNNTVSLLQLAQSFFQSQGFYPSDLTAIAIDQHDRSQNSLTSDEKVSFLHSAFPYPKFESVFIPTQNIAISSGYFSHTPGESIFTTICWKDSSFSPQTTWFRDSLSLTCKIYTIDGTEHKATQVIQKSFYNPYNNNYYRLIQYKVNISYTNKYMVEIHHDNNLTNTNVAIVSTPTEDLHSKKVLITSPQSKVLYHEGDQLTFSVNTKKIFQETSLLLYHKDNTIDTIHEGLFRHTLDWSIPTSILPVGNNFSLVFKYKKQGVWYSSTSVPFTIASKKESLQNNRKIIKNSYQFTAHPNPVDKSDILTLQFISPQSISKTHITLFDPLGNTLYTNDQTPIAISIGTYAWQIPFSSISTQGPYLAVINVQMKDGTIVNYTRNIGAKQ